MAENHCPAIGFFIMKKTPYAPAISHLGLQAFLAGLAAILGLQCRAADPIETWTSRTSPTNVNLAAVTFGKDTFVAIGDYYGIALTSPDGVSWTQRSTPIKNRYFTAAAYGNGQFVAVGDVGKIISSPNGIQWTAQTSGSSANLASVSFVNGRFVAVGSSGAVLSSLNGSNWTSHTTGATNQWRGTSFMNGSYVVVGFSSPLNRAVVATGSDLNQLHPISPGFNQGYFCVAQGAGKYVAGGWGGYTLTSLNGTSWSNTNRIHFESINDLLFQENIFIAVASAGKLMTSPTGTNWTLRAKGLTTKDLNAVAYGKGTFVVVGDTGTILQSGAVGTRENTIVLSQASKNGTLFNFKFTGTVGADYQIQGATSWGNWTPLSTIHCTASPMNCSLSGQSLPIRFFRVIKL